MATDIAETIDATDEAVEQPQAAAEPVERDDSDAAQTLAEIRALNAEVADAEAEYLESKEETSRLKKLHEAAVARLCARIARKDEQLPLFDAAQVDQPAKAWRALPIDELGMTEAKNEKLREAGIATLGNLADYQNTATEDGNDCWWRDLAGIGEKAATDIADRFVAFFEREAVT